MPPGLFSGEAGAVECPITLNALSVGEGQNSGIGSNEGLRSVLSVSTVVVNPDFDVLSWFAELEDVNVLWSESVALVTAVDGEGSGGALVGGFPIDNSSLVGQFPIAEHSQIKIGWLRSPSETDFPGIVGNSGCHPNGDVGESVQRDLNRSGCNTIKWVSCSQSNNLNGENVEEKVAVVVSCHVVF